MSQSQFQCIVVGGGFAGCAAAIRLAQKGVKVLLVERGDEGGAKNLSGGILWGNDLARILPDWKATAPIERPVSNKKVGFLGEKGSSFIIDYADPVLKTETVGYAVLRARTDKWLLEQAKKAGVTVITGVNVEGLHKQNGKVVGVIQAGEATYADCVIVADGANSRLTLQGDLRHGDRKLDMDHYALGVKEVLKLPKATLEERFGCGADGGTAAEFVIGRSDGVLAGGFLYTNNDTLSLGVVINLPSMKNQGQLTTHDIVEQFRLHPYIQGLVKGAELVEYGAHLVPEGGYQAFSELYADGVLVAGDAAGFCFSNGIVIQGMNYAVRSGICAADAVVHAIARDDFSAVTLHHYETLLEKDGIIGDFKEFKSVGKFLWNPRLFQKYPDFLAAVFRNLLKAEGPKQKMKKHLFAAMKETGVSKKDLLLDGMNAGVNL
ncbi:MAG: electron transfer flavoprotein-quinone oxidoreductase [Thermoplasmata archaeon]|nr:electron transfer flavoprotein-quinone oxidoreductase [Thermoplasmata archaeon]